MLSFCDPYREEKSLKWVRGNARIFCRIIKNVFMGDNGFWVKLKSIIFIQNSFWINFQLFALYQNFKYFPAEAITYPVSAFTKGYF